MQPLEGLERDHDVDIEYELEKLLPASIVALPLLVPSVPPGLPQFVPRILLLYSQLNDCCVAQLLVALTECDVLLVAEHGLGAVQFRCLDR